MARHAPGVNVVLGIVLPSITMCVCASAMPERLGSNLGVAAQLLGK